VLGPRTLLAHALGIDDGEIDCIARTGTAVTMCPVTAAKGARGVGAHGRMPSWSGAASAWRSAATRPTTRTTST
jgi:cytosine/adenosine deaminase-related metal-dependent hydrolase